MNEIKEKSFREKLDSNLDIKELANYFGILSILVICFSILKAVLYYDVYNIPIKNFITIGEISVLLTEDIVKIFISVGIFYFIFHVYYKFDELIFEEIRNRFVSVNNNNDAKKQTEWTSEKIMGRKLHYSRLFLIFTFYSVFVVRKIYDDGILSNSFIFWLIGIVAGFALVYFMYFFLETKLNVSTKISKQYLSIFAILFLSILFALFLVFSETRDNKNGKYFGTKIFTSDSCYISDKSHYYIGKTENYFFIYNAADSTSTIIKSDDVKKLVIKKNKI